MVTYEYAQIFTNIGGRPGGPIEWDIKGTVAGEAREFPRMYPIQALDVLGREGWELVSVVPASDYAREFFLRRSTRP
jgi:hypothetical protein